MAYYGVINFGGTQYKPDPVLQSSGGFSGDLVFQAPSEFIVLLTANLQEANDVLAGTIAGTMFLSGTLQEANDILAGAMTGTMFLVGSLQEAADVLAGSILGSASVSGALQEASDVLAGFIVITGTGSLSGALQEADDILAGIILVPGTLSGALQEAPDILAGIISVPGSLVGALQEASDVLVGVIITPNFIIDPYYTITPPGNISPIGIFTFNEVEGNEDVVLLTCDFKYRVPAGTTIVTASVVNHVAPLSLEPDPSPEDRLASGNIVTGSFVIQPFSTGVPWVSYYLTFRVVLSNNEVISITGCVPVVPDVLY